MIWIPCESAGNVCVLNILVHIASVFFTAVQAAYKWYVGPEHQTACQDHMESFAVLNQSYPILWFIGETQKLPKTLLDPVLEVLSARWGMYTAAVSYFSEVLET